MSKYLQAVCLDCSRGGSLDGRARLAQRLIDKKEVNNHENTIIESKKAMNVAIFGVGDPLFEGVSIAGCAHCRVEPNESV
jgi:hypothetical protein